MGKHCCVPGCRSSKGSFYRFPKNEDDAKKWKEIIFGENYENKVCARDAVVCGSHWPDDFETVTSYGKKRPKHPPSILPHVDQMEAFTKKDFVTFDTMKMDLLERKIVRFNFPVTIFLCEDILCIQSEKYCSGIPWFLLKIFKNMTYEAYHFGINCKVTPLSKNKILIINTWSQLEECIRFLDAKEMDHKKEILKEQIESMAPVNVGMKLYGPEVIVRAFEYFSISRALYQRLIRDHQLPSVRTLTRITSKVSNISENSFLQKVFSTLNGNQKLCVILHDEVYVKKMLLYHGGTIFGKALNNETELAKTVLGIMAVCLYGGPKFLTKILPISNLDSDFLQQQITPTMEAIKAGGGNVKAIISDGNRVNQRYFKNFHTQPEKPWLTNDNIYLLYDNPHLLKCIRNLWLTEKTGELQFEDNGTKRIAKWQHLKELFELEKSGGSIVKMSKLDDISIAPKPIERQKVATCLKVFCDATYNALLTHPDLQKEGVKDTAIFIQKVLSWWKIVNGKHLGAEIRFNDVLQGVIKDENDPRLSFLVEFGGMCLKMKAKNQKERIKQLSKDTAFNIFYCCNGLVGLCKHLLATSHEYVPLGIFTTDPLEKEFSKLRQGSGGTYFISAQQILEKLSIKQASLLLNLEIDIAEEFNVNSGHQCPLCSYLLSEEGAEIFDNLPELEESVQLQTKMSLVYIAGYISRKDDETLETDCSFFYYQKYGKLLDGINRGSLKIPNDNCCQWTFFCFILFNTIKSKVCKISLCNIFMLITEFYSLNMTRRHGDILANILLKNYCLNETPTSNEEPAVKVLKLS